jgi:hypothetical protein
MKDLREYSLSRNKTKKVLKIPNDDENRIILLDTCYSHENYDTIWP